MSFEVRQGDCVEAMQAMPAGSVDAVVCGLLYACQRNNALYAERCDDCPGCPQVDSNEEGGDA